MFRMHLTLGEPRKFSPWFAHRTETESFDSNSGYLIMRLVRLCPPRRRHTCGRIAAHESAQLSSSSAIAHVARMPKKERERKKKKKKKKIKRD